MTKTNKIIYAGVAGNPIGHSQSPSLFHAMFNSTGIKGNYLRLNAESAEEIVFFMHTFPLNGINITAPFKRDIIKHLNGLDANAAKINAVNTVTHNKGILMGSNTDVTGVQNALEKNGISLADKAVTVIGAGGAAEAAVAACYNARAKSVFLYNRTIGKAEVLAKKFSAKITHKHNLKDTISRSDIIISCIPQGNSVLQNIAFSPGQTVLDADYRHSSLEQKTKNEGAKYISGLEWLKYQALPAFALITGLTPPTEQIVTDITPVEQNTGSNIIITGFMGSGKSTVGRKVAEITGMNFIDTDEEIEKATSKKIAEIFAEKGEAEFRRLERITISRLTGMSHTVIALGGGATLDENNRNIIKKSGVTVWVYGSLTDISKKIDRNNRPLWQMNRLNDLWEKRKPTYAAVSDFVIVNRNKSIESAARQIVTEVQKNYKTIINQS